MYILPAIIILYLEGCGFFVHSQCEMYSIWIDMFCLAWERYDYFDNSCMKRVWTYTGCYICSYWHTHYVMWYNLSISYKGTSIKQVTFIPKHCWCILNKPLGNGDLVPCSIFKTLWLWCNGFYIILETIQMSYALKP